MKSLVLRQIGQYHYDENICLGEGAYGKVYRGIDTRTNEKVAIKRLDLAIFEKDRYLRSQIVQEIEIMQKFNHPNIVKFIELLNTKSSLYIITEMCKDGDLKQLLLRRRLDEEEVVQIMRQLVKGFKEMVRHGVIHRDLKPANILNHDGVVKIAGQKDFGFAKYVDNYTQQLLKSCVGSPLYMAPQILERQTYSTKCDIWSLGIIHYEMLFGRVPWVGKDEPDLLRNIKNIQLVFPPKPEIGSFSQNFIKRALTIDERERLTWDEVFELYDALEAEIKLKNSKVDPINFDLEIEQEEQVQKIPTWMNRALSNKNPLTKEQLQSQLSQLVSKREDIAYLHFLSVEIFNQEQYNQEILVLLSKLVIEEANQLLQSSYELTDSAELFVEKGTVWKFQTKLKGEFNFYEYLYSQILDQVNMATLSAEVKDIIFVDKPNKHETLRVMIQKYVSGGNQNERILKQYLSSGVQSQYDETHSYETRCQSFIE